MDKIDEKWPDRCKAKILKKIGSGRPSTINKGRWTHGYITVKANGTLLITEEVYLHSLKVSEFIKYEIDRSTLCMDTGYKLFPQEQNMFACRSPLYEKDYIFNETYGKGIIIWDEDKEEFVAKMGNGKILSMEEINNSVIIGNYYDEPNLLKDICHEKD